MGLAITKRYLLIRDIPSMKCDIHILHITCTRTFDRRRRFENLRFFIFIIGFFESLYHFCNTYLYTNVPYCIFTYLQDTIGNFTMSSIDFFYTTPRQGTPLFRPPSLKLISLWHVIFFKLTVR